MSAGRGINAYILDASGNPIVSVSGQINVTISGQAVTTSGISVRITDSGGNMIATTNPASDGLVASVTNKGLNVSAFNLGYNDTDGNWKRMRVNQSGNITAELVATGGNPGNIFGMVVTTDALAGTNFRGFPAGAFNLTYKESTNTWNRMRGDLSGYIASSVRVPDLGRSRGIVQVNSLSGGTVLASGDIKRITLMMPSKSSGGVLNASGYILVGYNAVGERPFIGGSGFEYNSGQGFMLLPGGSPVQFEIDNFNNIAVCARFSGEFVSYFGEQY